MYNGVIRLRHGPKESNYYIFLGDEKKIPFLSLEILGTHILDVHSQPVTNFVINFIAIRRLRIKLNYIILTMMISAV